MYDNKGNLLETQIFLIKVFFIKIEGSPQN